MRPVLGLALTIGMLSACKASLPLPNHKMEVAASIYPLAYMAEYIGGQNVSVHLLTPLGIEPHDFEPTPQDLATLEKAKVVLLNGGSIDAALQKAMSGIAGPEDQVTFYALAKIAKNVAPSSSSLEITDPHAWLDPVLAQSIVDDIAGALSEADPERAAIYATNAKLLIQELEKIDASYRTGLETCPVTNAALTTHDAFRYLTKRYVLQLIPIAGLSPDEEPSAKRMAELVTLSRTKNVNVVFFETLASPKLAQTLADELHVRTDVLNPIEGLTEKDRKKGKDYLALMRQNLAKLRTALRCP